MSDLVSRTLSVLYMCILECGYFLVKGTEYLIVVKYLLCGFVYLLYLGMWCN